MKTIKRRFTTEFKEEAVRLVVKEGLSTPEAARRLEISDKTLANWVRLARHGKPLGSNGGGSERKASSVSELEADRNFKRASGPSLPPPVLERNRPYVEPKLRGGAVCLGNSGASELLLRAPGR